MNKQLIILVTVLLLPIVVFAYVSPGKPSGLVNDFAKVLTPAESQDIGTKLLALNKQTGVELVVVVVPTIGTDETIESYAVKLFEEWGIGNKEKDTGLLLLVAANDRQVRIETGYGIEGAVTDIQSGNIIRNVLIPAFREGKYGAGISSAVDALTAIITKSPEAAQYSASSASDSNSSSGSDFNFATIFFVVIFAINALSRLLGKSKSWWLGGVLGAIVGAIIGLFTGLAVGVGAVIFLTILGLLFDFIVSKRPPGSSGGSMNSIWPLFLGGGHGGSGGFGGGGFGGFGGGSSGGGGASGRW